jgi:hypothetical protein
MRPQSPRTRRASDVAQHGLQILPASLPLVDFDEGTTDRAPERRAAGGHGDEPGRVPLGKNSGSMLYVIRLA